MGAAGQVLGGVVAAVIAPRVREEPLEYSIQGVPLPSGEPAAGTVVQPRDVVDECLPFLRVLEGSAVGRPCHASVDALEGVQRAHASRLSCA